MLRKVYITILVIAFVLLCGARAEEATSTGAQEGSQEIPNVDLKEESMDFLGDDFEAPTAVEDDGEEPSDEEIASILKETGLSDEDIQQINAYNKRTAEQDWEQYGEEGKMASEAVAETNAIVDDLNNYNKLKKETDEAQILDDSLSLTLGEENELTPSETDKQAQAEFEKEAAKPLTEEQKKQLDDLEDELNDIEDDDDLDFIDL